jgi:APA family basic amino acid/polyamine antiporter
MFGVGATIGTGIFIVLTEAVPEAGPGVVVSLALAGITAALTAVCYAELASTIPVSGSSYSYTYATMGENVAFGVAACLLLEYGVSAAAVAVGAVPQRATLRPVRLSHSGRHQRGAG